jgi:hypothetical protein
MKYLKNYQLWFFFIGSTILVFSCKHDEDPCKNQPPFKADFNIGEQLYNKDTVLAADTVYSGATVVFEAPAVYTSFDWKIGGDTRPYTRRKVKLDFYDLGRIEVQLIARRTPNTQCDPKDDGVDTVRKSFVVIPFVYSKDPVLGTYTGSHTDEPNKIFDVVLSDYGFRQLPPDTIYTGSRIWGLLPVPQCGGSQPNAREYVPNFGSSYRDFYIRSSIYMSDECPSIEGWGGVDVNGRLRIDYTLFQRRPDRQIKKTFIGQQKR